MRISVTFGQAELQDVVEAKAEQNCDPSVSSLLHPAEAAAKAPCPSLMAFALSLSQPHMIIQEADLPFCQAWVRGVGLHWHCGASASAPSCCSARSDSLSSSECHKMQSLAWPAVRSCCCEVPEGQALIRGCALGPRAGEVQENPGAAGGGDEDSAGGAGR